MEEKNVDTDKQRKYTLVHDDFILLSWLGSYIFTFLLIVGMIIAIIYSTIIFIGVVTTFIPIYYLFLERENFKRHNDTNFY